VQSQSGPHAKHRKSLLRPVTAAEARAGLCLLFLAGFLVISASTPGLPLAQVQAQTSATQIDRAGINETLKTAEQEIAEAAAALGQAEDEPALLALRDDLRAVRDRVSVLLDPLEARLSELNTSLAALGEPPADEQTETREIATERKRLTESIAAMGRATTIHAFARFFQSD